MDDKDVETRAMRPTSGLASPPGGVAIHMLPSSQQQQQQQQSSSNRHRYHPKNFASSGCRLLPFVLLVVAVGVLWLVVLPSPKTLQIRRTAGVPSSSTLGGTSHPNNNNAYGEQLLGDDARDAPKGPRRTLEDGADSTPSAPLPSGKAVVADEAEVHRDVGLADAVDKSRNTQPSELPKSPNDGGLSSVPSSNTSSSSRVNGSGNELAQMKIDLVLYVVFQTELRGAMYQSIKWPWIPRLDDDIEPAHSNNTLAQKSEGDAQDYTEDDDDDDDGEEASQKRRKKTERNRDSTSATTRQIVSHMVEETHERDRTRIAFLSINPHREHHYKVLRSQLLPTFFTNGSHYSNKERRRLGGGGDTKNTIVIDRHRDVKVYPVDFKHTSFLEGRVLREWELPGYLNSSSSSLPSSGTAGTHQQFDHLSEQSNSAHHHLEEFGAMCSLYRSGLTLMHSAEKKNILLHPLSNGISLPPQERSVGGGRPLAADADGDGVQEWMGILQADMKIDLRLIQLIRRRIRQGTARYLGINSTATTKIPVLSSSDSNKNTTAKRTKKVKIMFGGRIVQHDGDGGGRGGDDHPLFLADLVPKSLPKNHHCCVFYSGAYPAVFLFKNALGYVLLDLYNDFFTRRMKQHEQQHIGGISSTSLPSSSGHGNVTFQQLCAKPYTDENGVRHSNDAILGAFVIPNSLFNSQVFPFLDHIIDLLLHKHKTFPSPELSVEEYLDHQHQAPTSPTPLPIAPVTDVLERAVALTLGHAPRWLKIRLPVRHARDFSS